MRIAVSHDAGEDDDDDDDDDDDGGAFVARALPGVTFACYMKLTYM